MKPLRFLLILLISFSNSEYILGDNTPATFGRTPLPTATLSGLSSSKLDADEKMNSYIEELALCDIQIQIPSGYSPFDMSDKEYIFENISSTWNDFIPSYDVCPIALEAEDGNAVILFPKLIFSFPRAALRASNSVIRELQAVNNDFESDVTPLVKTYYNTDKNEFANADTIAIYEFQFENKLFDKYEYCIGVYLRSYAHPAVPLKIALNKDAYNDKEKYIKLIFDCIKFGTNPNEIFIEAEQQTSGLKDSLFE